MSWKPEVTTTGDNGKFSTNGLRFATEKEALASAKALMWRWMAVTDYRASESDDPVNYEHVDGQDVMLPEE